MLNAPRPETTIVPEGTHTARCIGLIHIGTVQTPFHNEDGTPVYLNKIRLTFEFPEETKVLKEGEEAKPYVLSQEYTLSMGSKSNLRPVVEGIVGTSLSDDEAYNFDFESLLGTGCLVSVKHKESKKGTTYAMVGGTSSLLKNQKCPPQVNKSKLLTYETWDQEYFDSLPDFIKETMQGTPEYKALNGTTDKKPEKKINVEDIPF